MPLSQFARLIKTAAVVFAAVGAASAFGFRYLPGSASNFPLQPVEQKWKAPPP